MRKSIVNNRTCDDTGLSSHEVVSLLQAYFVRSGAWLDLDDMLDHGPLKRVLVTLKMIIEVGNNDPVALDLLKETRVLEFLKHEAALRKGKG